MSASSSRSPGTPSKRMPISIASGKRLRGSTRRSSASYSPNASSGSSVRLTSSPTSLPSRACSTLGKMPPKPPWRYSSSVPSSSSAWPSPSRRSYRSRTTLPRSIGMLAVGERLADLEDFVDVRLRVHVLEDVPDHALLVDDEGRAQQARLGVAVHDLVLDDVIQAADFLLGVGEKLHREPVHVAEGLVREHVVARHAEDNGVELLEFVLVVGEADRLDRAGGRAVLRIEIQDDVLLATIAGEVRHLHARVRQLEGWRWLTYV